MNPPTAPVPAPQAPPAVDPARRLVRRAFVTIAGTAMLLLGVVLFITPGPGLPVLIAGMAILAAEYAWARLALYRMKHGALNVAETAQRHRPHDRVRRVLRLLWAEVTLKWLRRPAEAAPRPKPMRRLVAVIGGFGRVVRAVVGALRHSSRAVPPHP